MQKSTYKGKRRLYIAIGDINYDIKPETIINFTTNDVEQYLFIYFWCNKYDPNDIEFLNWNVLNTDNGLYWKPQGGIWGINRAFAFTGITKVKPNTNFEVYISGGGEAEGGDYGVRIFNLFEDELVFNKDKTEIIASNINHDYDSDNYSCRDDILDFGAIRLTSITYDNTWSSEGWLY